MGLNDFARRDLKTISSSDAGFGISMTFTAPDGSVATVRGLHTKHHLSIDPDTGVAMNAKTASVSVAEDFLTAKNYPVRNDNDEVSFASHKVKVKDSTGREIEYYCSEWFPDEKIGFIVIILQDYAD